jgi:GNAT superfamily N-acetyltransferase
MPSMNDTSIAYRPAVPDDALCLAVLATQVYLDTYAPEGIRPAIARDVLAHCSVAAYERLLAEPDVAVLAAERDGHLVGFAMLHHGAGHALAADAAATELRRLYVQEPFTGRGVGRALLREAELAAAAHGATTLWLNAWVGNARALQFYARCGYEDRGATLYTSVDGEAFPNRLFARGLPRPRQGDE